ncbi:MAG: RIO1 family regulatory kinase/ATPase [Candidatus Hermodarchaeota archaeon]|nr:RIO1 family regulatory kinase/ATPase [Candidatus Hermodarchaeota archaeon]
MPNNPAPFISKRSQVQRELSKGDGTRGRLDDLPEITLTSVRADALATQLATDVTGIISAGKEATVFFAFWRDFPLALKVYRLHHTPHAKGGKRKNHQGFSKDIMSYWASREFWILDRAFRAGVNVPTPARQVDNMFTARFIGEEGQASPFLKDASIEYPNRLFDMIIEQIFALYRAFIIHGDLSGYNILYFDQKSWIIDFPQAIDFASRPGRHRVLKDGRPILLRDITNIVRFFARFGIKADSESLCEEAMEQVDLHDRFTPEILVR